MEDERETDPIFKVVARLSMSMMASPEPCEEVEPCFSELMIILGFDMVTNGN